jgi:hypothetical protein
MLRVAAGTWGRASALLDEVRLLAIRVCVNRETAVPDVEPVMAHPVGELC